MATNDPPQQKHHPASKIHDHWIYSFYLFVSEPYLTKIQSNIIVIHKAYESGIEVSEKMDSEFTRCRLHFEYRKLKIKLLEKELVMLNNEYIILKDKWEITFRERNILVSNYKCLNAKIDALHN